jgi:hypothetical protein
MRSALLIGSVTILALTVLAGCAIGVEEFRFSAPSVDDRSIETKLLPQAGFEKMFILKDLAYTAFAANTQYSDAQVWVVPRVHDESPSSEPNFRIGINLRANQDGFVFDPSQVMLKLVNRRAILTSCGV